MAVKNCGKKWFKSNFHDDKKVKEITSGINSVNKIIDKNEKEHWVIVGLTKKTDGKYVLGIKDSYFNFIPNANKLLVIVHFFSYY